MRTNRVTPEAAAIRLPTPPAPMPSPQAFTLCAVLPPQGLTAAEWFVQQVVYRLAFEQAQAVVRPSLPERDLLGVWN